MTLDDRRIKDKLDELLRYHKELIEDLPAKKDFKKERIIRRGVEKTVELIADTILDIALMIISGEGFEKPEDSRSAIIILEKKKVLSKLISDKIQDLLSFRNLLVHRYGKVDEDVEYSNIKGNHKDVIAFIEEIEGFLKR